MEKYIHDLDKNNFFYDNITTLAYSSFGLDELFSRGYIMRKFQENPTTTGFINAIKKDNLPKNIEKAILSNQQFTPNIFVPGYLSKDKKILFRFDPNKSAYHFVHDTGGLTDVRMKLLNMTILSAFEKAMPYLKNHSPTSEFFRHIRNAAAHNGKFHFTKKNIDVNSNKLRRIAIWNNFEIRIENQNQELFIKDKDDDSGFWDGGDLIAFLLDFQNHHEEIKNLS